MLIDVEELRALGAGRLIVDTRIESDFASGHIPGAVHFDNFEFANEATGDGALASVARAWREMFQDSGVWCDGPVVTYDAGMENRAARPAVMMRALGKRDAYVLHGGIAAWLEAGGELTSTPTVPSAIASAHDPDGALTGVIGVDSVVAALDRDDVFILDVRDEREYRGDVRMQGNPRLGSIPRARHLDWRLLLEKRRDYPRGVGTPRDEGYLLARLLPAETLRAQLAQVGLAELDQEVIVYCQKSHRASLVAVILERLGFTNVSVYAGSFREWSRRADLPVAPVVATGAREGD